MRPPAVSCETRLFLYRQYIAIFFEQCASWNSAFWHPGSRKQCATHSIEYWNSHSFVENFHDVPHIQQEMELVRKYHTISNQFPLRSCSCNGDYTNLQQGRAEPCQRSPCYLENLLSLLMYFQDSHVGCP